MQEQQKLRQLAGPNCSDGTTCPGVFLDEANDRVLIRGPVESSTSLPLGDGEQLVEIPIGMLAQAASGLS